MINYDRALWSTVRTFSGTFRLDLYVPEHENAQMCSTSVTSTKIIDYNIV